MERLLERVVRDEQTGCLVWTGPRTRYGYGYIGKEGGRHAGMAHTHKVMWESVNGSVPDGLELDHLCRNRACCEPTHLEPVTHLVNVQRGAAARRMSVA